MDKIPLTRAFPIYLAAMLIAIAGKPLDIYNFHARGLGTQRFEPWRSKLSAGVSRCTDTLADFGQFLRGYHRELAVTALVGLMLLGPDTLQAHGLAVCAFASTVDPNPSSDPNPNPNPNPTPQSPAPASPSPSSPNTSQPGSQPAPVKADDPLSLHYGSAQPGQGVLLTPSQRAAAGPQAEPRTVTMDVLRDGSFNGETYRVGDTAEVPEDLVETLTLSGFGARADRVQRAQQTREAATARTEAARNLGAGRRGNRTTAVAPLSTNDVAGAGTRWE